MHLTSESQDEFLAAIRQIGDQEIVSKRGKCSIGTKLDLQVCNHRLGTRYRIIVPQNAELNFWQLRKPAYGNTSKKPEYPRNKCTLFGPRGTFQLVYDATRRAADPFTFRWLASVLPEPIVLPLSH